MPAKQFDINRLVSSASGSETPSGFDSFLYPSPFEASMNCFPDFDDASWEAAISASSNSLASSSAQTASTPLVHSLLQPSPMVNSISSPFVSQMGSTLAFPELDPAFTNCGPSLFDEFEMTDGADFALFESAPAQATPPVQPASGMPTMEQLLNTPMMSSTPYIPLQNTPFVPSLNSFDIKPESMKVSVDVNDLKVLIAAAAGASFNLGNDPATLSFLQQLSGPLNGQSNPASSQPVTANAKPFKVPEPRAPTVPRDTRPEAGGRSSTQGRRRVSNLYTCSHPGCGKTFTRAYNHRTHEETHIPDRPRNFVCTECEATFVRIHDLSRHALTHNPEKWHYCGGCSRGFARIDALQRHKKTSSGPCNLEETA